MDLLTDTFDNKNDIGLLVNTFKSRYGQSPMFVARAPGRVNLIGEHIDYCGYSVLPMAIEQDVMIAVRRDPKKSKIIISNVDPAFKEVEISNDSIPVIDLQDGPSWHHYFLCGYRGVLEALALQSFVGLEIMVNGVVPPSAGLSSSSALVCCSAIVTFWANARNVSSDLHGSPIDRKWIADVCRKAERYIGTQGGGMDQAICLLASKGTAKRIDFDPLNVVDIILPTMRSQRRTRLPLLISISELWSADWQPRYYQNFQVLEWELS